MYRFTVLDGLRGIAALFIVTRHTWQFWQFSVFRSYLAVDLFFMLSGFVLAHAYGDRLARGELGVGRFLLLRWIRLYPVYAASVLLNAAIALTRTQIQVNYPAESIGGVLGMTTSALLGLPYPGASQLHPTVLFPLNTVYWSLFFEVIVSGLFAASIRSATPRRIAATVIASGVGLLLCARAHHNLDIGFTWGWISLTGGFSRSVFEFTLGIVLYRLWQRTSETRPSRWALIGIAIPCSAMLIPSLGHWDWTVDLACIGFVFPAAILAASRTDVGRSCRWLAILGTASYPLYLLHKPVGDLVGYVLHGYASRLAPWSGMVLLSGLVAGAFWIERNWDLPLRRKLTALLGGAR